MTRRPWSDFQFRPPTPETHLEPVDYVMEAEIKEVMREELMEIMAQEAIDNGSGR